MASNYPDESDETYDFLCNTCRSKGLDKKAAEFCLACSEYFCMHCLKSHNSTRTLKDHRNKLLGGKCFGDMTKTRLQPASSVAHSSDEVIFGCHTCAGGSVYKTAVDYCKECAEYLCDICMQGHRKWTKHSKKMLGKDFLEKMIDARCKTMLCNIPRAASSSTSPRCQTVIGKKTYGNVSGRKIQGKFSGENSHGEVSGRKNHGEVSDNKLTSGESVTSSVKKKKIMLHESGDTAEFCVKAVCSLPDGGWLVTVRNPSALKRLDYSGNIIDRWTTDITMFDLCFIEDYNTAVVTTFDNKSLELVSISGDMTPVRTIKTDHDCYRVAYALNKLYVSPQEIPAGEVYEHDYSNGLLLRTIWLMLPEDPNFCLPRSVTTSADGNKLYVTDVLNGVLIIIDTNSADFIHYEDVDGWPENTCLGDDEGLFLAKWSCDDGDEILRLDKDGKTLCTMITEEMLEGLRPSCLSYDKKTARLAVTVFDTWNDELSDYIFMFYMK